MQFWQFQIDTIFFDSMEQVFIAYIMNISRDFICFSCVCVLLFYHISYDDRYWTVDTTQCVIQKENKKIYKANICWDIDLICKNPDTKILPTAQHFKWKDIHFAKDIMVYKISVKCLWTWRSSFKSIRRLGLIWKIDEWVYISYSLKILAFSDY